MHTILQKEKEERFDNIPIEKLSTEEYLALSEKIVHENLDRYVILVLL